LKILNGPLKCLSNRTVPLDISYTPSVVVLGLNKTGKTTLCKILSSQLSLVHLKPSAMIKECLKNPFSKTSLEI